MLAGRQGMLLENHKHKDINSVRRMKYLATLQPLLGNDSEISTYTTGDAK
jgi:hypothetical protein